MFARKRARTACDIVPTLLFRVRWDDQRVKYVAADTAGTSLGEFDDIAHAINCAHLRAISATEMGVRVLVVVQEKEGAEPNGWVAAPAD